MGVLPATLISLVPVVIVLVLAWRHNQRFRRTLRQIRALPEHRRTHH